MTERIFESGAVSWETFDGLYEHQSDLCRKLRFFIRAGHVLKEERAALEVLAEFLGQKESEMEGHRKRALMQRDEAGGPRVKVTPLTAETRLECAAMSVEDRAVVNKLMDICRVGGQPWENLRAVIEVTHSSIPKGI
jgi:hypothetical protein